MLNIVIPFYNSQNTICSLLSDLQKQTDKVFRVILVNDGSTDRTVEKIEPFILNDSRFELYTILNSGRSVARNFGLSLVKTGFVSFIDSDDRISKFFVAKLKSLFKDKSVKMSVVGWTSNYNLLSSKLSHEDRMLSVDNAIRKTFNDKSVFYTLWNKAFDVDFIKSNGVKFQSFVYGEDVAFISDLLLNFNDQFKVALDTDTICYFWNTKDSKHLNPLGIDQSNQIFSVNKLAINYIMSQIQSGKYLSNSLKIELQNELKFLLISHFVNYLNYDRKSRYFTTLFSAIKSSQSFLSKLRIVFNFIFGNKIEKVIYRFIHSR